MAMQHLCSLQDARSLVGERRRTTEAVGLSPEVGCPRSLPVPCQGLLITRHTVSPRPRVPREAGEAE